MDYIQIGLIAFAALVVLLTVIYYASHARRNKPTKRTPPPMPKPESRPGVKPEIKPEVKPEIKPEPKPEPPPAPEPKPIPKTVPSTPPSIPTGPRQITLYEFPYDSGIQICPGCDAENQHSYRFCWICGYKMP